MTRTLHLAYAETDSTGLNKDVSVMVDSDTMGEGKFQSEAFRQLESFLRCSGLITPQECLRTTTA